MTPDEIIRMALDSCDSTFGETAWDGQFWTISQGELERFYKLAFEAGAAHEREACAKVCEEEHDKSKFGVNGMHCAAAIRARSEK